VLLTILAKPMAAILSVGAPLGRLRLLVTRLVRLALVQLLDEAPVRLLPVLSFGVLLRAFLIAAILCHRSAPRRRNE
jgi:hypothetical protein